MKKIVLSLAGVMAAVAFAPEASALPVFARQTGMACSACHFQHFPLLNGFGRAFKAAGFTMVGAQGKIEGDRLSIPDTLNMAFLTSMGYEKTNQLADTSGVTKNYGNGAFYVPGVAGEASLFVGGRVNDYSGFLSEITLGGAGAALDSAKLPMLPEIGNSGIRLGVVPFATNAQGASYGFEYLNTGANAVHSITNTVGVANGAHINAVSAQQYISTAGTATGAAIVANSDFGFVNVTKYDLTGIAAGNTASLGSTYLRVVGTFDMAGWDSALGVQSWSGQSWDGAGTVGAVAPLPIAVLVQTKATAIDGQMQGTLGDMPTGFYFSYAKAPASTGGMTNLYSTDANAAAGATTLAAQTLDRSSFNIDAEIGIVPEVVTLGAAIRRGKSGVDAGLAGGGAATGSNMSDNAIFLTVTYKIAQNMLARLSYTTQSGDYWNVANTNGVGSKTTTLNLYNLF